MSNGSYTTLSKEFAKYIRDEQLNATFRKATKQKDTSVTWVHGGYEYNTNST